jgi:hypothetical protein
VEQEPTQPEKTIILPSDRLWFDPMALTINTSLVMNEFTMVMNSVVQVATANARRIAIGFFQPSPGIQVSVAPWPDVAAFQFDQQAIAQKLMMYNLFTHGIVVCSAWYINPPGAGPLRVLEWLRESR